mgnify:CR=1 FL=1
MKTPVHSTVAVLGICILIIGASVAAVVHLVRSQGGIPIVARSVETRSPIVGVHTRLTDEVEEWKIRRTLEMVREMGSPWIVEYFPWGYVESERGRFDWKHSDIVINNAYAQGLRVIARIDYVPQWARPKDTTPRYLGRDHFQDYGDFIYAFVNRYKGRVRHYVIWNEPNLAFEWGYRRPQPEDYAALLEIAYSSAKRADPDAVVLSAGLAPTLENSEMAVNDLVYLQRLYEAGAGEHFDGLAVHAYGGKLPPDDPAAPDRINYARVELVRQIMVSNGDGDKPIFITEAGWNDHPRWTRAVRPALRIEYTVRAYRKAAEEWPWVQALAMWAFRLPFPARNYNDYYTFVTPEFTPKPIYEAVQRYARGY